MRPRCCPRLIATLHDDRRCRGRGRAAERGRHGRGLRARPLPRGRRRARRRAAGRARLVPPGSGPTSHLRDRHRRHGRGPRLPTIAATPSQAQPARGPRAGAQGGRRGAAHACAGARPLGAHVSVQRSRRPGRRSARTTPP
ncbi:hypothetical protein QJS66_03525 [Kocuria rhizophila]|nr:hypothetical protein QJS66_03525 [Kocuria rhizophila]